jgi:hypothetical protein
VGVISSTDEWSLQLKRNGVSIVLSSDVVLLSALLTGDTLEAVRGISQRNALGRWRARTAAILQECVGKQQKVNECLADAFAYPIE